MKVVHDWLKEYIGDSIPSAKEVEDLLTFHAFEIEGNERVGDDDVIDVDVLPNRSSDCLCHRGVAREIATLTKTSLSNDPLKGPSELEPKTKKISINIEDTNGCRRFGAALVTGVKVGPSPDWLKRRLEAVGQRSINNVVDVTNYVMLSLGQPLHAYDGDKFPKEGGVWNFGVRFAKDGEKVVTLSDEEFELDSTMLLITEEKGNSAVGIAGVKGGKTAEVDDATSIVILEAANFDPTITRKAAQKLKLPTDASRRFENEVSRDVVPFALREAVRILEEIAGAACEGYLDAFPTPHQNPTVSVRTEKINALLGLSLEEGEISEILERLGFNTEIGDGGFSVVASFERTDINIEEDVIEEVGRVYGYEHIESVVPETAPLLELNARHYYCEIIRKKLFDLGFSEVITSSFRKKDEIKLQNALASDKGFLRSALQRNIIEVLDKNITNTDILGLDDIRVFEIGNVFEKGGQGVCEHVSIALGVRTKKSGYTAKDKTILEETLIELERNLNSTIDRTITEGVAEFNVTELLAELPEPKKYTPHDLGDEVHYTPFSTFPFVSRDIALWVSDAPGESLTKEITSVLRKAAGELCVRIDLFDEFSKDGRTSYAFRIVFQSKEKTLTDSEVSELMARVTSSVSDKGWEVR